MKRNKHSISIEAIKQAFPLPKDLKPCGVEYNFKTNCIEIYGFSDTYEDVPEGVIP